MFRACFAPPVSIISRAGVLHAQGCLICQSLLERQFASVRILDYSSGDTIEEWSADIFVRNAGVVNTEADKNHHADKSAPPATKIRHFQGNVRAPSDVPVAGGASHDPVFDGLLLTFSIVWTIFTR